MTRQQDNEWIAEAVMTMPALEVLAVLWIMITEPAEA